jgi:hypothetical protein
MKKWRKKMIRKAIISLVIVLFAATVAAADGAKVIVIVPDGMNEVSLLSQGTAEMLRFIHSKYEADIKRLEARYNISELKNQVDKSSILSRSEHDAMALKVQDIRNEYISRVSIKIDKVNPFISPESSATGEIEFTYTATNYSDRIIADIIYSPVIGKMEIQTSSKLVLDFVDRSTFKAGLAPGKTMITTEKDPDRFSFVIGQMNKNDLAFVRKNVEKGLSLKIKDIHFTNSIEYKDQSKVLTIEEAFPARLKDLIVMTSSEKKAAEEDLNKYNKAREDYDSAKSASLMEFNREAGELKKSAVRYTSKSDKKGRAVFKEVLPGNYFIYGNKDGRVVFKEISVKNARLKVKATELQKDPFKP